MFDHDSYILSFSEEGAYTRLDIYIVSYTYMFSFQFVTQGQERFELGDDALFSLRCPADPAVTLDGHIDKVIQ